MSASIDSLHSHPQLQRQNPKLAAIAAIPPTPAIKEHVTDYFCQLTGGPALYRGRTMRDSHVHLDITEADWNVFVDDTVRLLDEFGVAPGEQGELVQLMEGVKPEIIKPARPRGD